MQSPQSEWGLLLSQMLTALGQTQYGWAMNQIAHGQQVTDQSIANFLRNAGQSEGLAGTLINQYQNQFSPEVQKFIAMADSYNSPERQKYEMGRAESTVGQADTAALSEAARNLQGMGINPSSGRYADLAMAGRIADAAARAGAGNKAYEDTAAAGRDLQTKVMQFGQNVPSMASNALNTALQGIGGAQNANLGQQGASTQLSTSAAPFMNAADSANKLPPVGNISTGGSRSSQNSNSDNGSGNNKNNSGNQGNHGSGGSGGGSGGGGNTQTGPSGGGSTYNSPYLGMLSNIPHTPGPGENQAWPSDMLLPGELPPSAFPPQGPNPGQGGPLPEGPYDPFAQNDLTGVDPFSPDTFAPQTPDTFAPYANAGGEDWNNIGSFAPPAQDWADPGAGNVLPPDNSMNQSDLGSSGGFTPDNTNMMNDTSYDPNASWGDSSGGSDFYDFNAGADAGFAQGGGVLPTTGGHVPSSASPSAGAQTDDVPARLNAGEFVIPKDVVAHKGTEFFNKMIAQSRKIRTGMAGPPTGAKMKPALRMNPTFTSQRM
jgi:hypothetical protein